MVAAEVKAEMSLFQFSFLERNSTINPSPQSSFLALLPYSLTFYTN